jgi:hypothetical protein
MLNQNKKRVILDVSPLPTTGESNYFYHNTSDGCFYYWNDVTGKYVKLENINVIDTIQPTPTATGNTTNLNSAFMDSTGKTWIVDINGDAINTGSSIVGDRYKTSSTTCNDIVSNGNLTFNVQTGLSYSPLQDIIVYHNSGNYMNGSVVSYDAITGVLVAHIQSKTGAGNYCSWDINLDGVAISPQTVTTITGTVPGAKIATYKNENEVLVDINQTVTGITASYNSTTQSIVITHSNENGTQPPINVGIGSLYPDTSATAKGLVNLVNLQQLGANDKLINSVRIGRGGSLLATNTVVGENSMNNITTATNCTGLGNLALRDLTTGGANTALGYLACARITTGNQNVAVGNGALGNTSVTTSRLTAIGTNSLNNNTTGTLNVGVGWQSLFANTTGSNNIAVGDQALRNNLSGNFNIAIGASSLTNNNGNGNLGFGQATLFNNSTGANNTAIGSFSMFFNTTGSANLSFGNNAMRLNTTGSSNTVVGTNGLSKNTTGGFNVAIGESSLLENLTGINNTGVGRSSLSMATAYNNTSGLGYNTQVTGSNQVQLGDATTTTYVYGTVQNRSDLRDKTDVIDTVLGLDFINSLRPVDYRWDLREDYRPPMPDENIATEAEMNQWLEDSKLANIVRDGSKKRPRYHHGLIAQEVKALMDSSGIEFGGYQDHSLTGGEQAMSLGYDEFIAPLIKAVQQLSAKITILENQILNP